MNPQARKTIKKANIIAKKRVLHKELLDLFDRHKKKHASYNICRKFNRLGLNKTGKRQNITKGDLREVTKLNDKSLDDLKKIAR